MLGVITMGQSPRRDLERVFGAFAPDARVRVAGALDGLDSHEISDLARRATDDPQLVRLIDGSTREIGLEWLHPRIERLAQELANEEARVVVVATSAEMPECRCDIPVIVPSRVVLQDVLARAPRGRVGVVTPLERQARATAARWLAAGLHPVVTWASPVRHSEVVRASAFMQAADVDLVLLDSIGHEASYAEAFVRGSDRPVITTQEAAAREATACLR